MTSIRQTATGRPADVLEILEDAPGLPADDQLQVAVLAAPVLPMDHLRIRGLYPLTQQLPGTPGAVGVGRVVHGPDSWRDALVCLPMRAGSWGERVNIPIDGTLRLPDDADPVQASLLRVNGLTAQALLNGLQRNAWVLMNAGHGGVSHFALQLARRMGVRTVAVVRRDDEPVDADVVLLDGPDLALRVKEAVHEPIHRALDGVGGQATARLGNCLAQGGRVVHYGAMSRQGPRLDVADALFRGVLLQGFWLYRVDEHRGAGETGFILDRLLELGLRGRVDSTWSFTNVLAALERDRAEDRRGRVLLTP